jgi:uncharacterized protein (TIGR03083 family)
MSSRAAGGSGTEHPARRPEETTTLTDEHLQSLVAAEYLALADLLDTLPATRWDTPSLCAGWRVREVVAHLTMPARYDEAAFLAELRDCAFDFTRLSDRIAGRDAELPADELVRAVRSEVLHRWTPPGGGAHGALNHVVIHGLDVTVPLGEPRRASDAALQVVLDDLTEGGGHGRFGTDIGGQSLQATDLDWSYGSGPPLRGPAEELALHLCGRSVPAGRLHREGSAPGAPGVSSRGRPVAGRTGTPARPSGRRRPRTRAAAR